MDQERPQDRDSESTSNDRLEDELDQVLSAASSLVEKLSDEVGTPDEADGQEALDETAAPANDTPDFMAELTRSDNEPNDTSSSEDAPSDDGSSPPTPELPTSSEAKLGVVGSANFGVIGRAPAPVRQTPLDGVSTAERPETQSEETAAAIEEEAVGWRWSKIPAGIGLLLLSAIAPLLETLDKPAQGLSQPLRHALGILGIATLATALLFLLLSFW